MPAPKKPEPSTPIISTIASTCDMAPGEVAAPKPSPKARKKISGNR